MNRKRRYVFKVLVIGDVLTGKTALVKRYVQNFFSEYYRATTGVDFSLKIMKYDEDTVICLQLWDLGGNERFGHMTQVYYKEAVACFIVFDAAKESSFEAVTKWKTDLDNKVQLPDGNPIPCVLIANKCDLAKEGLVNNVRQMDEFCKENGIAKWFETSAKENINIEASFQFLISEIMKNIQQLNDSGSDTINVTNRRDATRKNGSNCYGGNSANH